MTRRCGSLGPSTWRLTKNIKETKNCRRSVEIRRTIGHKVTSLYTHTSAFHWYSTCVNPCFQPTLLVAPSVMRERERERVTGFKLPLVCVPAGWNRSLFFFLILFLLEYFPCVYYVAQTPTYVDVYVHCVLRDALEDAGTAGRPLDEDSGTVGEPRLLQNERACFLLRNVSFSFYSLLV